MKISDSFSLNWHDALIGLLTAVGTSVVAVIGKSIDNSVFTFDWTTIWHAAVAGAFGYLQVKFFIPAPKVIKIDPSKTSVVDNDTKETILKAN